MRVVQLILEKLVNLPKLQFAIEQDSYTTTCLQARILEWFARYSSRASSLGGQEENPMDKVWWAAVHGVAESNMTEAT